MYINEPVLKGNRKKATTSKYIAQYEFSNEGKTPTNQSGNFKTSHFTKQKIMDNHSPSIIKDRGNPGVGEEKAYRGEMGFQSGLVEELTSLIKKWEGCIGQIGQELKQFDSVYENDTELKAFQHCVALIETEFNQSDSVHENARALVDKKLLQVKEVKLRILNEIEKLRQENNKIRQQNSVLEDEEKQREKKRNHKKMMQEKLWEEKERSDRLKNTLAEKKKTSYEQKNQFIEIQAEEFRLESEISRQEEETRHIEEETQRYKKYQELIKIKQKILLSKHKMEEEARPHLERKIDKIARIRSQLKRIEEVLELSLEKIQDQTIIIEALKEKSYHQEAYHEDDPNLYRQYLKKYNNIYFGEGGDKDSWNDYNKYLKHLLKRSQDDNDRAFSEMPYLDKKNYSTNEIGRKSRVYTKGNSYTKDILDLRPSMRKRKLMETQDKMAYNSTKISYNPSGQSDVYPKYGSTRLPKLVKMQGREGEQKNIKQSVKRGLIKSTKKEQDFSLESIDSNDSNVSGQVIEVEFHKK